MKKIKPFGGARDEISARLAWWSLSLSRWQTLQEQRIVFAKNFTSVVGVLLLLSLSGCLNNDRLDFYLNLDYRCYSVGDLNGYTGNLIVCEKEQEQVFILDNTEIVVPCSYEKCPYKLVIG